MAFTGNMFALLDDEDGPKPAARAPAKAAPAAEKKSAKMPEKSCAYSPWCFGSRSIEFERGTLARASATAPMASARDGISQSPRITPLRAPIRLLITQTLPPKPRALTQPRPSAFPLDSRRRRC